MFKPLSLQLWLLSICRIDIRCRGAQEMTAYHTKRTFVIFFSCNFYSQEVIGSLNGATCSIRLKLYFFCFSLSDQLIFFLASSLHGMLYFEFKILFPDQTFADTL